MMTPETLKFAEQAFIVAAAIAFAVGLIYYFVVAKPDATAEDNTPMPLVARRILVWYLILIGADLAYTTAKFAVAEFPEAGYTSEPMHRTNNPSDASAPVLDDVDPQTDRDDPTFVAFTLFGRNFTKDTRVCFGSVEKTPTLVSVQHLNTRLEQTKIVGVERVDVFVINSIPASGDKPASTCATPPDKATSNTISLKVRKGRATVSLFGAPLPISREIQLIVLALFAGALGSYVHALKSLTDFIGNRTLTASWFWWYVTRPFLGASMAMVFYAVLRGGFLAGTPADAKVVNPFGVMAICALVGMFADKAAQKLGEIFDTLFTAKDPRSGKLAAPVIDKLDPDRVPAGAKASVPLKIVGDRLGKVNKVMVGKAERTPSTVSEKQVTVDLQPDDLKQPRDLFISVGDPDGVSPAATLHVTTDLTILPPVGTTGDALPPATQGQAIDLTFTATGGKAPHTWELASKNDGLTLAAGKLSGTIQSKGEIAVTIKLTDSNQVSVSKPFNLKVT